MSLHKNEGASSVGLQPHVQSWEKFKLKTLGSGIVAFESSSFANVYLRFDGEQIKPGRRFDNGGGKVNAQFGIGTYEQYLLKVKQDTGIVAIESRQFPGRYLRATGNTVNGQGISDTNEEFEVILLSV
ncbi:hypothetical protein CPB86DRAFT_813543 [Serendipita vermifera]|nr:hypothetical protein CPB86DRAFT_813543 [Serendipita vermifera]